VRILLKKSDIYLIVCDNNNKDTQVVVWVTGGIKMAVYHK